MQCDVNITAILIRIILTLKALFAIVMCPEINYNFINSDYILFDLIIE